MCLRHGQRLHVFRLSIHYILVIVRFQEHLEEINSKLVQVFTWLDEWADERRLQVKSLRLHVQLLLVNGNISTIPTQAAQTQLNKKKSLCTVFEYYLAFFFSKQINYLPITVELQPFHNNIPSESKTRAELKQKHISVVFTFQEWYLQNTLFWL